MDPCRAIAMGSLNTARHYGKRDMGAVVPGYRADLVVFDDLGHVPQEEDSLRTVQALRNFLLKF